MEIEDLALERVQEWLELYGGPSVPVAALLCDDHADGRIMAVFEDAAGTVTRLAYAEARDRSAQVAGALRELGVRRGDRVAVLLPKTPELLITLLGIWRLGAVHVPLFTAFGSQAIAYRLAHSGACVLVTDEANRTKVDPASHEGLRVLTVTADGQAPSLPGDIAFAESLLAAAPIHEPATLAGDDPMMLIYTSGTTGHAKGVVVPVRALAAIRTYMHFGFDLRPDDVFWNAADPGWAYGLYYGVIGPLLSGQTALLVNAPFDAERTEQLWRRHGVTNFAAAPTVYRALRAAGVPKQGGEGLRLRVASSAGEPLNPEVIAWAERELGVSLGDHYGQTEHGMVVNNHHHPALRRAFRPGSMGHAMPGFRVTIIDEQDALLGPRVEGQLAIEIAASPLFWFAGYFGEDGRNPRNVSPDGRFYRTGDAASMDDDGYVSFSGRADDLINSAGYRIGPFEVESALVGHPAVAEAAVIGVPDALRGERVKAFVVLRDGWEPADALGEELGRFVRGHLGAHAYPREVAFVAHLPKTPSGKIQRFLLRAEATQPVVV